MGAAELYPIDRKFQTLREQLSLYGLNPVEWNIFANRDRLNSYELEHRDDSAFRIKVQVRALRTGLLRVDRLSVVSI